MPLPSTLSLCPSLSPLSISLSLSLSLLFALSPPIYIIHSFFNLIIYLSIFFPLTAYLWRFFVLVFIWKENTYNICAQNVTALSIIPIYYIHRQAYEKIFYSRSTNSAAFCALQCMTLPLPFHSMQLKLLTPFLIQGSEIIMKKVCDFSQSCNPFTL